jgi:hypothetical protein
MSRMKPKPIPEEKIRQLAQEIWEAEGRPEDRALRHWFRAEAMLRERECAKFPEEPKR